MRTTPQEHVRGTARFSNHAGDRGRVGFRGWRPLEARPAATTPVPPRCLACPVAGASQPSEPREPASAPRDGLAVSDGKRPVQIRQLREVRRHEFVSWHTMQRIEHPRIKRFSAKAADQRIEHGLDRFNHSLAVGCASIACACRNGEQGEDDCGDNCSLHARYRCPCSRRQRARCLTFAFRSR